MVELFSLVDGMPGLGSGRNEIVGSSHGWIAVMNRDTLELFLWSPVSGRRIDLPPIHNLPIHWYSLETTLERKRGYRCVKKLIISSSTPEDADCRVVMSYGPGFRLAFCCPGHNDAHWISIGDWWYPPRHRRSSAGARVYDDFAYCSQQSRLICITRIPYIELERWDLRDPSSPMIDGHNEEPIKDKPRRVENCRYLVIAESKVFLVVRSLHRGDDTINDPGRTLGFNIFKVVEDGGIMSVRPLVGSLDGLAMFVGLNHSFAISAAHFPNLNLKPNSIYFTDPTAYDFIPRKGRTCLSSYGLGHCDIGIFDYSRQIFYPCSFQGRKIQQHSFEVDQGSFEKMPLLLVWFRPADPYHIFCRV